MRTAQDILLETGLNRKTIAAFLLWHRANPDVWAEFEKITLDLINKGRKHYGAKAIMEVIRFNRAIGGGREFKINNNFTAYYVRVFEEKYKIHKGFFETRELKNLDREAG